MCQECARLKIVEDRLIKALEHRDDEVRKTIRFLREYTEWDGDGTPTEALRVEFLKMREGL